MATRTKRNGSDGTSKIPAHWRHDKPGKAFRLQAVDPGEKALASNSKSRDKDRVDELAQQLDEWQNLFYADRRYKLLVILQGIDGSGKDGTLRGVFSCMTPLGVRTVGWKAPNDDERDHDYLWRIHHQVPRHGEIVIFNRSHYEDVLVPVVSGSLSSKETKQRFEQINDFERMLTETGTTIVKFMLHISKDEQRERLQARIDDPAKRWKFQPGDLEVRRKWDDYQLAYQRAISATGTPWAPWLVVPADSKTHRNLVVATELARVMSAMGLRYPDNEAIASVKVE